MNRLDGHVVVVAADGSFTPSGRRLTGPVSDVDKLETLIDWAAPRDLLQPLAADDGQPAPARVWVVGTAWAALAGVHLADGAPASDSASVRRQLSAALGTLVAKGWELGGSPSGSFLLSRPAGKRFSVELLVEPDPWLAAGEPAVAEDAAELGRRATAWSAALGVLPAAGPALSAAALMDTIMAARAARRGGGAVLAHAGALPAGVHADPRVLPEWVTSTDQAETAFTHAEELVLLRQEMGRLASAGMVTLGHGQPRTVTGPDAAAAAAQAKRPFGLWRAALPTLDELNLTDLLPAPHPQMRRHEPAHGVWLTTEDLTALSREPRDGGAGLAVEDLHIDAAVLWPQQGRLLEAWATRLREARDHLAGDPILRHLIDTATEAYLTALADPTQWDEGEQSRHFQPAWLATIAAHVRARALRVAQRTAREYRVWPLWARDTDTIYAVDLDQTTGRAVDLSDTHTRLGRMITAARVDTGSDLILAVLLAESPPAMAHALTAPFDAVIDQQDSAAPPAALSAGSPTAGVSTPVAAAPPAAPESPAATPTAESPRADTTPAGRTARQKSTTPPPRSSAPAAVLHSDGLWLPDGTRLDITEPVTHAGHVAELALRLASTHNLGYRVTPKYAEVPQIWLTDEVCTAVGIDVDAIDRYKTPESVRAVTEGIDFVALAAAEGWRFGGVAPDAAPRLGVWTRLFREGDTRGALIALIPAMALKSEKEMPILLTGEATPLALARRLQLFADTMKWPWNQSSNTTALDLMLHTRPRTYTWQDWKDRVFAPSTTEPPYGLTDVEEDFNWTRIPSEQEQRHRFVHAYDRGASYPSAIAGLELPIGDPVYHAEPVPFDPKTPGYWLIEVPDPGEWRLPYILNPRGLKFHEPKWVTTPRLERAIALGYEPTILQAVIWPEHGRILNNWYQRFRDAATALDPADPEQNAVLKQTKVVRSSGIGMMGSETYLKGRTGYSPERRFHIVAKASGNIVHALAGIGENTGRWPVAVLTDTVLYLSDDPDPAAAWPGDPKKYGTGFGQFKPEGSALLADHLRYLDGGAYRGKDQLVDPEDWLSTLNDRTATGGT